MSNFTRELVNLTHANVETIREYLLRGRRSVEAVNRLRELFSCQMQRADRQILYALTRHLYEDEVASYLLTEVIRHMEKLEGQLARPVSIKVAALDYFETVEEISDRLELIHENQIRQLLQVAIIDELTGAHTREFFDYRLQEELERSWRYGRPLTLVLFDIDHFKEYNDAYGHLAGDEVLRGLGRLVRSGKRDPDLFYRYGGEEFALLLPVTDAIKGARLSQRILEEVREELPVTISLGIAELTSEMDADALVAQADHNLYQAKNTGRDRVVTEQTSEEREDDGGG